MLRFSEDHSGWEDFIDEMYTPKYYNGVMSLDIETTSVVNRDEKGDVDNSASASIVYAIQVGFMNFETKAKLFYLFRSIDEFSEFFNDLVKVVNTYGAKLFCYVHNLGFEWQHLKRVFMANDPNFNPKHYFFNNSTRKLLRAKLGLFGLFILTDTYQLTGKSLRKIGEELAEEMGNEILKGDLDYELIRTPNTPLTSDELHYMLQDVNILLELGYKEIYCSPYDISDLPLTSTSKVRKALRGAVPYKEKVKIWNTKPDFMATITNREAFYGGFTHANATKCMRVFYDVECYDITSAHPTAMLIYQFPVGKIYKPQNIYTIEDLKTLYKTSCFWLRVHFTNIRTEHPAPAIYRSSDNIEINAEYVNGKLAWADEITVSLLDLDLFRVLDIYQFDSMEIIGDVYASDKGYITAETRQFIYQLYKNKTEFKNVPGKELEYKKSKELLNSVFGMCGMNPIRDVFTLKEDGFVYKDSPYTRTKYEELPLDEAYQSEYDDAWHRYNGLDTFSISHLWGSYIAMYSRHRLFQLIDIVGEEFFLYCDTDSVYYHKGGMSEKQYNALTQKIEKINSDIIKLFQKSIDNGMDVSNIPPKDPQGTSRPIGVWTFDGAYKKFATRGAKSYLVTKQDGKLKLTHSGLPKSAVSVFEEQKDPYKFFLDNKGFTIKAETGFHKSKTYIEGNREGDIVDYLGNPYHYQTDCGLIIYNSDYNALNPIDFKIGKGVDIL